MTLDDLRLVLAVAQHGSFVGAARQTGTPIAIKGSVMSQSRRGCGRRKFSAKYGAMVSLPGSIE